MQPLVSLQCSGWCRVMVLQLVISGAWLLSPGRGIGKSYSWSVPGSFKSLCSVFTYWSCLPNNQPISLTIEHPLSCQMPEFCFLCPWKRIIHHIFFVVLVLQKQVWRRHALPRTAQILIFAVCDPDPPTRWPGAARCSTAVERQGQMSICLHRNETSQCAAEKLSSIFWCGVLNLVAMKQMLRTRQQDRPLAWLSVPTELKEKNLRLIWMLFHLISTIQVLYISLYYCIYIVHMYFFHCHYPAWWQTSWILNGCNLFTSWCARCYRGTNLLPTYLGFRLSSFSMRADRTSLQLARLHRVVWLISVKTGRSTVCNVLQKTQREFPPFIKPHIFPSNTSFVPFFAFNAAVGRRPAGVVKDGVCFK